MALSKGDIAECKEIGRVITKEALLEHIKNCPHHQAYLVSKARIIGLIFGVVVTSGVSSGTVAAIIMKFFMG